MTDTLRKCRTCGNIKPLSDYTVNRKMKDGLSTECRDCGRVRNNKAYAADPEKHRKRVQKYRESDPEKAREILRASRARNRDFQNAVRREERRLVTAGVLKEEVSRRKEEFKKQYEANPLFQAQAVFSSREAKHDTIEDRRKEARKVWKEANKEAQRLYHRDYIFNRSKNDPDFHKRGLEIKAIYRHKKWHKDLLLENGWIRKVQENDQPIDTKILRRLHAWQQDHCYFCNAALEKFTIEHILPRYHKGPSTSQNLVLTCETCNYGRRHKIYHLEWLPRQCASIDDKLFLRPQTIKTALEAAGIEAIYCDNGAWALSAPNAKSKTLVIVSTFFGSDRNPGSQGGKAAKLAQERFNSPIVLFDYEWFSRREACINMIRSKMNIAPRALGARELQVVTVSHEKAVEFLNAHHVMGARIAPVRLGLTDGENIFGIGLFHNKGSNWECDRLSFRGHVPGGMSKIMKALWAKEEKKPIRSFVDSRYADGSGHETIGFRHVGYSPESYQWVLPDAVRHQRYLSNTNKMLRNLLFYQEGEHRENIIRANGIFKIWTPRRYITVMEP